MKNKLLLFMLIILVSITLVGVVTLIVLNQLSAEEDEVKEPTIEEIVESSVDIPEITTNISGNNFARLSIKIQTDSPEAATELAQRDFQVKDILIEELSEMTKADLEGKEGKKAFEDTVKLRVNELLQEGKVIRIYTTSIVIQ
ncbi:flagellar basal body-associated protein FliL [Jeotgalibacillus soli]|uniref:Flagellar protein FliL n=1 Tax=Jeotgalibacillus soli TaxID=889306 RepID=A0A0C2RT19_9BACL|nr:flagellar basal body-associated protein FliL [Jeotgalibacillus soli]KIL44894.1 flagellar basal body protein FliL [Jeotgalibacillus soli]